MKKSIFSAGLFKDGLKRIKVASLIFMVIIALIQAVIPLLSSISEMHYITGDAVPQLLGPENIMEFLILIPLIMAPVLTLIAFYPFNRRSSSDFYHSLPYTRTCIYISWMVSVLAAVMVTIAGGVLLGYLVRMPFPRLYTLSFAGFGDALLSVITPSLFAIGCVMLAMSFTGTWLSNIAASLLIMFLPRFIMYIIRLMLMDSLPIVTRYFLQFFAYEYNVFVSRFVGIFSGVFNVGIWRTDVVLNNVGADIYTLIIALVYMAIGLWIFVKRKSESAGQSALNRKVQAAIRIAITFTISVVGTVILTLRTESFTVALVIYIIALIAFFAYEIITTHKWKNLVKALPSLLIVAGLNVLVFLITFAGKEIIVNRYIPADKIDSIQITDPYAHDVYNEYFGQIGRKIEIRDEEAFKIVSDALTKANDAVKNGRYYEIKYGIRYPYGETSYSTAKYVAIKTGGQTIWRNLMFTAEQAKTLMNAEISQEYKDNYMKLPEPVYNTMEVVLNTGYGSYPLSIPAGEADQITGNAVGYRVPDISIDVTETLGEMKKIYDTLQGEIEAAGFENWFRYMNYYDEMYYEPVCYRLTYFVNTSGSVRVNIPITKQMFPDTFDLVISLMCENMDLGGVDEFLEFAKALKVPTESGSDYDVVMTLCRADGDNSMNSKGVTASSWNNEDGSNEAVLNLLESCLKNGKKPDSSGFIVVEYNRYDAENGIGLQGSAILPLPVEEELLEIFETYGY